MVIHEGRYRVHIPQENNFQPSPRKQPEDNIFRPKPLGKKHRSEKTPILVSPRLVYIRYPYLTDLQGSTGERGVGLTLRSVEGDGNTGRKEWRGGDGYLYTQKDWRQGGEIPVSGLVLNMVRAGWQGFPVCMYPSLRSRHIVLTKSPNPFPPS